jgi:hypothetical protein
MFRWLPYVVYGLKTVVTTEKWSQVSAIEQSYAVLTVIFTKCIFVYHSCNWHAVNFMRVMILWTRLPQYSWIMAHEIWWGEKFQNVKILLFGNKYENGAHVNLQRLNSLPFSHLRKGALQIGLYIFSKCVLCDFTYLIDFDISLLLILSTILKCISSS